MKSTNMACLTPDAALSGDCDFLSANLCARSLFGEDALANLSIEKTEEGVIQGHVRIRSKTQGIALSLGTLFFLLCSWIVVSKFVSFVQQVTRLPLRKRQLLPDQPFSILGFLPLLYSSRIFPRIYKSKSEVEKRGNLRDLHWPFHRKRKLLRCSSSRELPVMCAACYVQDAKTAEALPCDLIACKWLGQRKLRLDL